MIAKSFTPENGAKVFVIMNLELSSETGVASGVGGEAEAAGTRTGARRFQRDAGYAVASARSAVRLRVWLGSTGMPGPIEVVMVTFLRYRPLAAAGLSLITSSRAAP
jgi:hypothetical protein